MKIFKCLNCGNMLEIFYMKECSCGFKVPCINGVFQFTEDKPIQVSEKGFSWLGYEKVGANYEPAYALDKENDKIILMKNFMDFFGENKIILDLGAGLCGNSISLALSGCKVIAGDISQKMLEEGVLRATANNVPKNNIIFARMNGYKLNLNDKSVDGVLEVDMLHQIDSPELVVSEIKRVLKPDGYYIKLTCRGLEYTPEQQADNTRYNSTLSDITAFYNKIIDESGFIPPTFQNWQKADEAFKSQFIEYKTIDMDEATKHSSWNLRKGLHKLITRASGSKQLISDEIHEIAWSKTNEYAENKYGKDYLDINRSYNHMMCLVLYKMK